MSTWHVDEGLAVLIAQWKKKHPGAVVGTIGDAAHQAEDSEHNPERQGSAPGADAGEVDAGDFMPGHGVTEADLVELRRDLLDDRDPRLLYVIWHRTIVSSVVSPWVERAYSGAYHSHLHVSVNDKFDANRAPWDLGKEPRPMEYAKLTGDVPLLQLGDEDVPGKVRHINRLQVILNHSFGVSPRLDEDGVYGPKSAAAVSKIMRDAGDTSGTTKDASRIGVPEWRRVYGVW